MKRIYASPHFCAALCLCVALLFAVSLLLGAPGAFAQADGAAKPAQGVEKPSPPAPEPPPSLLAEPDAVSVTVGQGCRPKIALFPEGGEPQALFWQSDDPAVAAVDADGNIMGIGAGVCTVTVTCAGGVLCAEIGVEVTPHAEITYIDGILIANKTFALPADYNPGVDGEAAGALDEMIAAAKAEGIALWVVSGFRSYNTQAAIYANYTARDGAAAADRYSARPGHSEHQTGLAFDLNSLEQTFGATPEGQWLAANCHEYGFIIRYPEEKEDITGYMYEPWHVRYLGKKTAREVFESGLCLEEYLNITSVYGA